MSAVATYNKITGYPEILVDVQPDPSNWPIPQPLPEGLQPVVDFSFDLLPETLKPWASDISELMQVSPDYIGISIITGLGSVIGRKVGIRPQLHTNWTEFPNQWAMLIGRPSLLKSPAMAAALAPLERLQAIAIDGHESAMKNYKLGQKLSKLKAEEGEKVVRREVSKKDGLKDAELLHLLDIDSDLEPPSLKRYKTTEATHAALGELHRLNPNGLLVFRDELVSLLKSLDREESAEARGFYLTGWNGNSPYTIDRIGRGLNLHIQGVCLSVLGSTQPGKIGPYIQQAIHGGVGDDGLLQRFSLMVWPDKTDWRDVDRKPDKSASHKAFEVFKYLDDLNPLDIEASQDTSFDDTPDGQPYLRFDPAAHEVFLDWRIELEARLRSDELSPALESHLAKYRKLVPGLALAIHLADKGTGAVSLVAAVKALAWSQYLETHARRIYGSASNVKTTAAKLIIARIKTGHIQHEFSIKEVWRPGWTGLTDSATVKNALALLVDYEWIGAATRETSGRTATVYTANPRAFP